MRVPRLATIAVGLFGLAAAMAGTDPGAVGSGPIASSQRPSVSAWPTWPSGPACSMPAACRPARRPLLTVRKPTRSPATSRAQIRQAYGLPALYASGVTGRGTTIVIVDSFGSPTIRNDLTVFDKAFGLPAPPKFTIIQPAGRVPPYDPNNSDMVGWAGETTLDVEYAHVIAPGASILLVETPVSETEGVHGFPQIVTAEEFVIRHHLGDVISQSFSATEQTFPSRAAVQALRGAYQLAARNHVTVLAASGDSGAADVKLDQSTYYPFPVTSWPDSDPLVTAVGGTQLHVTATGKPAAPTVWNDTYNRAANEFVGGNAGPNPLAGGGGRSVLFGRPGYQDGVRARRRQPPRRARHLDERGLRRVGGHVQHLSRGAGRLVPGVRHQRGHAAVRRHRRAGRLRWPGIRSGRSTRPCTGWRPAHARGIVDVTKGSNTVSFTQGGGGTRCAASPPVRGYDLASGVGTVNAAHFVGELAAAAGR